jgi:DNA-directed RNA polymerase specialized sigma24 family protein
VPSEGSFRRLLTWLDAGVDSGGERYVDMRRRLSAYFDRRNCRTPDDLADETLNRVARRLEEEGSLQDGPPGRYCYIVAKFVFLEYTRQAKREGGADPDWGTRSADLPASPPDDERHRELQLASLERCLDRLSPRDRELILEYYGPGDQRTADRRRQLAARLGLTANALTIRACRIRDTLEGCVRSEEEAP